MLHHVRGAAMPQPVRTRCLVQCLHKVHTHWRVSGMPRSDRRVALYLGCRGNCARSDRARCGVLPQIFLKGNKGGSAKRNNALLVPFPRTCTRPHPSPGRQWKGGTSETRSRPRRAIRQWLGRGVPSRAPVGAMPPWMHVRASRPLQARPATWAKPSTPSGLDVHRRIVIDAFVQKQPLVKPAGS